MDTGVTRKTNTYAWLLPRTVTVFPTMPPLMHYLLRQVYVKHALFHIYYLLDVQ